MTENPPTTGRSREPTTPPSHRNFILILFGSGAAVGAPPMLLFFWVGRGPHTVLLFPGGVLTFLITGDPHSEAGLVWITVFNAVVYGAVTAGMGGLIRRSKAPADNRCARCSYDLTGNVSGVCPECGTPVEQVRGNPDGP